MKKLEDYSVELSNRLCPMLGENFEVLDEYAALCLAQAALFAAENSYWPDVHAAMVSIDVDDPVYAALEGIKGEYGSRIAQESIFKSAKLNREESLALADFLVDSLRDDQFCKEDQ